MNRKQLIVIWVLVAWLAFAVVYSSYYPAHSIGGVQFPTEWDFGWQDGTLMVLSLPAILLAFPLLLTLRGRKSG